MVEESWPSVNAGSSRTQCAEDHIHVVPPPFGERGLVRKIAPENSRQCPVVRQVEISDGSNGNVDLDRV